jgi:membrane-associated phospholipid phosphatase
MFISPFFINKLPENVPVRLNENDINVFDRTFMFSYNKPLDIISNFGVCGLFMLPALSLVGNIEDKNALFAYTLMYSEAALLTLGTQHLLKKSINRYRPYMYFDGAPDENKNDYNNSFPSGATALAFMSAGFLAVTFSAEYPDSAWKTPLVGGAYALAGGDAACRIISGSHFISDVLAGMAIGSLIGTLIPILHKKPNDKNSMATKSVISVNPISGQLIFKGVI